MAVEGNAIAKPGVNPLHKAKMPSFLNIFDSASYFVYRIRVFVEL